MRVATSMIFDAGVSAINRQTASLLQLQQQVATGRRILKPSDDPVAAARSLEVTQSKDVLTQYSTNQDNAKSALGLQEAQLTSINDMFARIKELTVQAGNATLTSSDRRSIAFELRARFDELLGIANSADGQGLYLFSGYMGATKPFGATVDSYVLDPATAEAGLYQGDDGQRKLQVSATRFLEISDSGKDIFMRINDGNGYFTTDYSASNTGTGVVDIGSITDPAKWNASTSKNVEIRFFVDSTASPEAAYYDLVDTAGTAAAGDDVSLLTGAAPAVPVFPGVPAGLRVFQSGQTIDLKSQGVEPAFDLGGSVAITGSPATGDIFSIRPSSAQSVFKTLADLINALETRNYLPADQAMYANDIAFALNRFDQANDNILRVRAMIGSRMGELDSLGNVNEDLMLQYQETLSNLQDLDYAKTISDLTRKQTDLEAAQKSYLRISQLSLFNYL